MPDLIKFSDLTGVLTLNDSDLLAIAAENEASETGFTSAKVTIGQLSTKVAEGTTFSNLKTQSKYLVPAINELAHKDIISTLETGETTLTIIDSAITTDSTIDIYTDKFGVSPTNQEVTSGQIVLTFSAQSSDLAVKVRLS